MNAILLLSVLRARIGVFALVLAATVLAATIASLALPKTYRATTSLLVDAKDEQSLTNVLRPLYPPQERPSYMQTQMDVITSQKVARLVVRGLKLADDPKARADFEDQAHGRGSIEDWLIEGLRKRLKVETTQSNLIHVSFDSRDAALSAKVVNAFAKAYMDTLLALRVEPTRQAAAWFDEQLKSLRARLERAQARLSDYQRRKGIVSADERLDVENARLGELSIQLARAQGQAFDWATRERQARAALERDGAAERLPDILNNPYVQKLNQDLLAGEARLQELATQYGPNYPAYQRQQSENQALRERRDAQMRKIIAGIENAKRQSQRREAELRAAMAALRTQLLEHRVDRNQLAVLTRDVETAQHTYEAAMQRYVVNQVESRASQTNVTVLDPAVAPRLPYRPRIALNIALAVLAGTMLGFGIVALGEMLDRRVRLASDLAEGLGVPLLATLDGRSLPAGFLPTRLGVARRYLPKPD